MGRDLFFQIISAIFGLWIADKYIVGVDFKGPFLFLPKNLEEIKVFFSSLVFAGIFLGFLNYFIKPVLKTIALPLRIITFNLFSLVIAMFLVWLTDLLFIELIIKGVKAVFLTTLIIWVISLIFSLFFKKGKIPKKAN